MKSARAGWSELRVQWVRYTFTGVSMLVGVLGIVGIAIVSSIAAEMLVAQQEQLNGREATFVNQLHLKSTDLNIGGSDMPRLESFHNGIVQRIGPQNADTSIEAQRSMLIATQSDAVSGREGTFVSIEWVMGDVDSMRRLPLISGTRLPDVAYPPTVTLNESALRILGVQELDTVSISSEVGYPRVDFVVSGVVADGRPDASAYGRWSVAKAFFEHELLASTVEVKLRAGAESAPMVERILQDSANQFDFVLAEPTRRADTVAALREQLDFFRAVFGACALLILLIAALGTANVGIASVSERSRELVVRRALGARRRDVFAQVLWSSLALGFIVSLIAVASAIGTVYLVIPKYIPVATPISSPAFPWAACAAGVISAIGTSIIGGTLPAIKATRLPVALALRE